MPDRVKRWRDPTGQKWTALLTREPYGLHFSVQGNGRRPTDEEVDQAFLGHVLGAWVEEKMIEITGFRDELGDTVHPHVRQFAPQVVYAQYARMVADKREAEADGG